MCIWHRLVRCKHQETFAKALGHSHRYKVWLTKANSTVSMRLSGQEYWTPSTELYHHLHIELFSLPSILWTSDRDRHYYVCYPTYDTKSSLVHTSLGRVVYVYGQSMWHELGNLPGLQLFCFKEANENGGICLIANKWLALSMEHCTSFISFE